MPYLDTIIRRLWMGISQNPTQTLRLFMAYLERRLAYNRRNNVSLDFLVRVSDAAFLKSETLLPGPDLLSARRPCSPTRRRRSGAPCALRPSPPASRSAPSCPPLTSPPSGSAVSCPPLPLELRRRPCRTPDAGCLRGGCG